MVHITLSTSLFYLKKNYTWCRPTPVVNARGLGLPDLRNVVYLQTCHITDITSKSSKVLGMIKRTLGPCKPDVKETAYNMLVWSKLEMPLLYGIHTPLPKLNISKRYGTVQPDLLKTTINAKQSQQTNNHPWMAHSWATQDYQTSHDILPNFK